MDEFLRLEKKIDSLKLLVESSLIVQDSQPIDVKHIAKLSGVSVSCIYGERFRYLIPMYGLKFWPTGRLRYPITIFNEWQSLDESSRLLFWTDKLSSEIKEKIVMGKIECAQFKPLFEKFKEEITKIESEVLSETSSKNCI